VIEATHNALLSEKENTINNLEDELQMSQNKAKQESLKAAEHLDNVKKLNESISLKGKRLSYGIACNFLILDRFGVTAC
jgi:hypothetical protein